MTRKSGHILLILAASFLLMRFAIFFSPNNLFQWQEFFVGALGNDFVHGTLLPLTEYKMNLAEGPGILQGLLSALAFLVFGEHGWVIKLIPALFNLGALLVLYSFLDRFFSRRIALLCAAIFLASPPLFAVRAVAMGDVHFESIFFILSVLYLFCSLEERIASGRNALFLAFASGWISGVAFWFDYLTFPIFFVCFLLLCCKHRVFLRKREFALLAFGFLTGCIALIGEFIYYGNITHTEGGSLFVWASLPEGLNEFWRLLSQDIVASFSFPSIGMMSGAVISWSYYVVAIAGLIGLVLDAVTVPSSDRRKYGMSCILAFLTVYLFLYCASPNLKILHYNVDNVIAPYIAYKFVLFIYPFVFIVLAFLMDKLLSKHFWGGISVLLLIIVAGTLSQFSHLSYAAFQKNINKTPRPYCYGPLGASIGVKYRADLPKALLLASHYQGMQQEEFLGGIGYVCASDLVEKRDPERRWLQEVLSPLTVPQRQAFLIGMGVFIMTKFVQRDPDAIHYHQTLISYLTGEDKQAYLKGAGIQAAHSFALSRFPGIDLLRGVIAYFDMDPLTTMEEKYSFYEGMGRGFGWDYATLPEWIVSFEEYLHLSGAKLLYLQKGISAVRAVAP